MVYRKKTLEEQQPAPVEQELVAPIEKQYPIKKLMVDADTLLYKIDGTNVDVHIFLDVGMKYQDKDKIWHQIPELKMSVERDYKRLAGLRVDQMMELMKAGYCKKGIYILRQALQTRKNPHFQDKCAPIVAPKHAPRPD